MYNDVLIKSSFYEGKGKKSRPQCFRKYPTVHVKYGLTNETLIVLFWELYEQGMLKIRIAQRDNPAKRETRKDAG